MKGISCDILLVFLLCTPLSLWGQTRILNASFEGEPRDATIPRGWMICQEGTTPDILPGPWGVYTEPSHGNTYLGLITRENGTWEAIGQRLMDKLQKDKCYQLAVDLARSETYTGYNDPIKVRIWIGKSKCQRTQLIFESDFIHDTEWKRHNFTFSPKTDMQYILIEAFVSEGRFSHKGNVLIDNLSPIMLCGRS